MWIAVPLRLCYWDVGCSFSASLLLLFVILMIVEYEIYYLSLFRIFSICVFNKGEM